MKGVLILTVFCLAIYFLGIWVFTQDLIYVGNEITLRSPNHEYVIDAESVTLEAASREFFILMSHGEVIVGKAVGRGSSWYDADKYYIAGPVQIKGGALTVFEGTQSPVMHLTTTSGWMTVREEPDLIRKFAIYITIFSTVFVFWVIVFLLITDNWRENDAPRH